MPFGRRLFSVFFLLIFKLLKAKNLFGFYALQKWKYDFFFCRSQFFSGCAFAFRVCVLREKVRNAQHARNVNFANLLSAANPVEAIKHTHTAHTSKDKLKKKRNTIVTVSLHTLCPSDPPPPNATLNRMRGTSKPKPNE